VTERVKDDAIYDDVVAAPSEKIAELVGGSLYVSPRPSPRHANCASVLGADLNGAFQRGRRGPGGWWILDEPEVHLFGDVFVPDIAGWRRHRLVELPDTNAIELAPDWVCEVLSPSTERFDRRAKMPRYAIAGVGHLWVVDPAARRLQVYGLTRDEWALMEEYSGDAVVSAPPFEAVPIELAPLWS
jgi:Uma2 family endonuclease